MVVKTISKKPLESTALLTDTRCVEHIVEIQPGQGSNFTNVCTCGDTVNICGPVEFAERRKAEHEKAGNMTGEEMLDNLF